MFRYFCKDIFVFYSDGVSEARNGSGELFGEGRVIDLVRENRNAHARELVDLLHNAVTSFSGSQEPSDDLTCVAVGIK